jgi:hypothetical protein
MMKKKEEKKVEKPTEIQVTFRDTYKMRVSIVKSAIEAIWVLCKNFFVPVQFEWTYDQTKKDLLKTFLILVAKDCLKISQNSGPGMIGVQEIFCIRHPWYYEVKNAGLFSIDEWPYFDFFTEDFSIKEVPYDEPF